MADTVARLVRVALVVAIVLVGTVNGVAADRITRYVLSYTGPESAWKIDRAGVPVVPHHGLPLNLGDCVHLDATANGQSAAMTIINDGREITLSSVRRDYCVQAERRPNAVGVAMARSFSALVDVFHSAEESYDRRRTVRMTTRSSDPPVLPLMDGDTQLVESGSRRIALAWSGGAPPYTITLESTSRPRPVAETSTMARRLILPPVDIHPGTYTVSVRDESGSRCVNIFTAVPPSSAPKPSSDMALLLADEHTPVAVRATYDAARLMADPSDRWRLEAYQRVAASVSPLAMRLAFQLETGS
jgi:hypothetical protein